MKKENNAPSPGRKEGPMIIDTTEIRSSMKELLQRVDTLGGYL